jgi:hypothetical protein
MREFFAPKEHEILAQGLNGAKKACLGGFVPRRFSQGLTSPIVLVLVVVLVLDFDRHWVGEPKAA